LDLFSFRFHSRLFIFTSSFKGFSDFGSPNHL
jgi:hypothetical protein